MASEHAYSIFEELGIISLWRSSKDTKSLIVQRFVRLFAYGGSTLILVAYLAALGFSSTRIGLFMTLTLIGDTVISFVLTFFADSIGRKAILAAGAILMSAAGAAFASSGSYWVLLVAAVVGVISPSGNEIGPFRAIEESTLAQLTPPANRGDIYAWYSLLGTAGAACGMMTCGWMLRYLRSDLGWNTIESYRAIFWAYAMFGLIKLLFAIGLSSAVEAEKRVLPIQDPEVAPLLGDGAEDEEPKKIKTWFSFKVPHAGIESTSIVIKLCLLFSIDSFASSLAALSWITWFFHEKFGLQDGKLGTLFFTTSLVAAGSMLVASSIAKRIGNINTMVFTHLPSSIFLALIGVPNSLPLAITFLILRSCTQSMDVAPRAAFLAAVVLPHERTSVMGLINVVKTSAQTLGPLLTGLLSAHDSIWMAFLAAGALKVVYDLGILAVFAGHQTHDDATGGETGAEAASQIEEETASRLEEDEI